MKRAAIALLFAWPLLAQEPAALFGRVVAADTREPVRRADVKLLNVNRQLDVFTDGEGRFRFQPVPAQRYFVTVRRDGFVSREYETEPSDFTDPKELLIELNRQGVIAGRIVNAEGLPLLNAHVEVIGRGVVVRVAESDDRGLYRASNLDPGNYSMRVTYRDALEDDFNLLGERKIARASRPGPVQVKAGGVTQNIDFILHPGAGFSVRGHISPAEKLPDGAGLVWLEETGGGELQICGHGKGEFACRNVAPGTYRVAASVGGPEPLFAESAVQLESNDVSDVGLTLRPMPVLTGRIAGRAYLVPLSGMQRGTLRQIQAGTTGEFRMVSEPGDYDLVYDVKAAKEIRFQGKSILETPRKPTVRLHVALASEPQVLELTN